MIKLKSFTFNAFAENTYIVWEDETKEAVIIDPGCFYDDEKEELKNFISEHKLIVKFLINTHCHLDHIFGVGFIKNEYKPIYYSPEPDLPLLQNAQKQAKTFGIEMDKIIEPDEFITEDIVLMLGQSKINFLFTPGHSPGEYCIYLPVEKLCVTGDVLFNGGIGRTDLWGGDYDMLMDSIARKLLTLPDETRIYPGHGDKSTIGVEKSENPFLKNFR